MEVQSVIDMHFYTLKETQILKHLIEKDWVNQLTQTLMGLNHLANFLLQDFKALNTVTPVPSKCQWVYCILRSQHLVPIIDHTEFINKHRPHHGSRDMSVPILPS